MTKVQEAISRLESNSGYLRATPFWEDIRTVIEDHQEVVREMHMRELHHFEEEQRAAELEYRLDKQATGLTKEYE